MGWACGAQGGPPQPHPAPALHAGSVLYTPLGEEFLSRSYRKGNQGCKTRRGAKSGGQWRDLPYGGAYLGAVGHDADVSLLRVAPAVGPGVIELLHLLDDLRDLGRVEPGR